MIVVIPMLGLGKRFSQNGYSEYKPFVKINTEPLISKVLKPLIANFKQVYVICNSDISQQLKTYYDNEIIIVEHNTPTKGAAETLLQASDKLPINEQIACVDCDTIFHESAINKAVNSSGSFLLTFKDMDKTGLYSYVNLNDDGSINSIQEKVAISHNANAGFYVFEDLALLKASCASILELKDELYISKAIQCSIDKGSRFYTIDITNEFDCCGTPYQLKNYAKTILRDTKYTLAFDIDKTLIYDLYDKPQPVEKNVKFCNEAYKNGHKIILHTARGMLSKNGNIQLIEASRPYIERVLADAGVLYHELILMKPFADVYIDDKAIPAHRDLQKETGLYFFEDHLARNHNKVVVSGNDITKYGNLKGECYYYNSIPQSISMLFPIIHQSADDRIVMQKLQQPTYSSLLLSRRLTKIDIDTLLRDISSIHTVDIKCKTNIDVLWAYKDKVVERFSEYEDLYTKLNVNINHYKKLSQTIEQCKFGVIHGDAVFTNIFAYTDHCKFIDMRGMWSNKLTMHGDIQYDYAKILQSLWGYDYALHNEPIQDSYLQSLREHYLMKLKTIDSNIDLEQLHRKTKLLYISMLPFHKEDITRCKRFIQILDNMKN